MKLGVTTTSVIADMKNPEEGPRRINCLDFRILMASGKNQEQKRVYGISRFPHFFSFYVLLNIFNFLRIHQRYRELNTELIPKDFTELDVQPRLKYKFLQQLPELKVRKVNGIVFQSAYP